MIFVPLEPAAPAAPACRACGGEGVIGVRALDCSHSQPCPCDVGEEVCDRCEGTRVDPCSWCGEPSTIRYLGQNLCDACAPSVEHRFDSCSICDAPIDVREIRVPLCASCCSTARAAGEYAAEATRQERERRAS